MTFTDEGGIWMWSFGQKVAVLDDSKAFSDWISSTVALGTGETPQEFAERVVAGVLREHDDWRPDLDNFARWARLLFPDCANLEPAE